MLVCTPPLLLERHYCRSVGAGLSHLHRSFGRYSKKAPSYRSAARQRQNPFRIPSPFDPDVRGGTFDGTEVFRCKVDVRRSEVFFKAMQLGCARNRNDPRLRVRVSSTASTSASLVNRRCGTSKCVGWPALQWSATNNPADHFVQMVGYSSIRSSSRGPTRGTFGIFHDCVEQVQLAFAISSGVSVLDADSAV